MTTKHKLEGSIAAAALGFSVLAFSSSAVQAYTDIDPIEAYEWATTDPNVYILDVRTPAEWKWVGHPGENKLGEGAELNDKVVNIPYKIENGEGLIVNPSFLDDVDYLFGSNPNAVIINMCRSGSRSVAASNALDQHGYMNVYNMLQGFEGGKDERGYRTVEGWKNRFPQFHYGLPNTY